MKTKEIVKEMNKNYYLADVLMFFLSKKIAIKWLISRFGCSYSTAYYLASIALKAPHIFARRCGYEIID